MRTRSILGLLAVAVAGVVVYRRISAPKTTSSATRTAAAAPPPAPASMLEQFAMSQSPSYNGIPYGKPQFVNGRWVQPQ